jgi:hypothetical protein
MARSTPSWIGSVPRPWLRKGPRFVHLAPLETSGNPARKKPLPIKVGMRGEARIVVGRRPLIQYAFEPIRQLTENMTE